MTGQHDRQSGGRVRRGWAVGASAALIAAAGLAAPTALAQEDRGRLDRDQLEAREERRRMLMEREGLDQRGAPGAVPDRAAADDGPLAPPGMATVNFPEPVSLSTLSAWVAEELGINIVEAPGLANQTVNFNAPVLFPEDELLELLRIIVEDAGFVLTRDQLGDGSPIFKIREAANLGVDFGPGPLATTRVIQTPLLAPSRVQQVVSTQLGAVQPTPRFTALDDEGILVVTASPTTLDTIGRIVERLSAEAREFRFFTFDLEEVAATFAIDRISELYTEVQGGGGAGRPTTPQQAQAQAGGGSGGGLGNLTSRLFVERGNRLLFRGTEEEAEVVAQYVELVDEVSELLVKPYLAGSVALDAARAGESLGLGPVLFSNDSAGGAGRQTIFPNRQAPGFAGQQQQTAQPATSRFMVNQETGQIIYYGTASQHERVSDLVERFRETTTDEDIVIRTYKLRYATAGGGGGGGGGGGDVGVGGGGGGGGGGVGGVVEVLTSLLEQPGRQQRGIESPFLPRSGAAFRGTAGNAPPEVAEQLIDLAEAANVDIGPGTRLLATSDNTIIVPDEARNQIIIKAPRAAQEQLAELIEELDQKQPQVLIEVQIVSVTTTNAFNFSADVQLDIGEFSFLSAFGASAAGDGANIDDPRAIPAGGTGLTTGIIQTDYIPLAIRALETQGETRIVSRPQILVNDNIQASLVSEREEPFLETTQNANTTQTSQGGTASAGTRLEVTPRIAESGDLTLQVAAELSDFVGAPSATGLQPPTQSDEYDTTVTLPSDSSIVIGGFQLESDRETIDKVPILGDIPGLGLLFQSRNTSRQVRTIFVFITPRVVRDRDYADLRLLSEGPMEIVGIEGETPELMPAVMPISGDLGSPDRLLPRNEAATLGERD